jgi:chemotaxis protein CheY-P-specific phosphatase CheC
MRQEKEKMKNREIFSVSIAAVLLVISVAAVSADDFSSINQLSGQFNNNIIITTAGDNAIVGDQTINSRNIQAQRGLTVQTGAIVAAGGDISDSSYTYTKSGSGSSGSNSATTNQLSAQFNNNIMITTAGDNAIVGDQTINSRNIQAQLGLTVQSGDIVAAGGDISDSSYTKSGSGSSGSNSATTNQLSAQFNNNIMITTAGDNATVGDQTINSRNIQAQQALTVQSGDIVAVGGDIEGTSFTKSGSGSSGSNSATTNQLSAQFNNNIMITTAGDNATVGDQTINSRNIQTQQALTVQSGDIVAAGGDIEDSTYSTTRGPLPRP